MADDIANDEIRVQVGSDVEVSQETADALENLAEALAAEADGDDVAGFSFQSGSDSLFMMGMGMGPKIGVKGDPDGGMMIGAEIRSGCAIDIVIKVPI